MSASPIAFSVYLDGKLVDRVELDRPIFNIGKLSTSTVRLDDINVSRKHAVVERRDDGRWRITDLGSTNGTLLRGERIEQAELADGDRLVIGRTTLVVHIADAPPQAMPAATAFQAPVTTSGQISGPASGATSDAAPAPTPARPARPAPARVALPQTLRAEGFSLPSGSVGLGVAIVGALVFAAALVFMPWQRFALAGLAPSAVEASAFGWVAALVGLGVAASAIAGLASGKRYRAARIGLGAGLGLAAWIALAGATAASGPRVMAFEDVGLQPGFFAALWGVVAMIAGGAIALASLPRWDETTSLLRLLVSREGVPLRDLVVYEPREVDLARELDATSAVAEAAGVPRLPRFRVTREGDVTMTSGGDWKRIRMGERGTVVAGETRVSYLFVRPLAGRARVALTSWTEATALGLLAALAFVALGVYAVLGWDADARREIGINPPRMARVEPLMAEDQVAEKAVEVQIDLPEPTVPDVAREVSDEKAGDAEEPDDDGAAGDESVRTADIVDRLNPRTPEPPRMDPNLSPSERQEAARERAQLTALASTLRADNPLMADLMDMNVGSDRRIDLLVAMAGPGSTFATGAHDPFGGTFTGDNGFPGGPAGGPPGGPDGPTGPVVADLGKPRGPRDVSDLPFNPRDPGPIIEEQKPRVSDDGGLDSNTVQQYIRRYLRGVKACYQDGLQANPKLGGGMTLEFTILPSGGVLEPRIARSTLGDAALEQCVVTKMGRWSFPAPKNGGLVEVSYRLVLKAR